MSETGRDSGWSEQYAETGGWPPPAEGQRSYGPGTPPGDPSPGAPHRPDPRPGPTDPPDAGEDGYAGRPGQSPGPASQPDGDGYARPGHWSQQDDPAAGGTAPPGPWGQQADPAGGWSQPTDQTGSGYGQPGQSSDGGTGQWGQPADQAGQWGQPADQADPWGQPADQAGQRGQPADQADPWGQPADQAGQRGQPADQADPWGQPADQADPWGRPADQGGQWVRPVNQGEAGPYGPPAEAWAPGDSAYGRLGKQTPPPPPQQRPRRPWEGRPAPARRPSGTPVVTMTLIAICVVLYLVQQADPGFTARYALIPFAVQQGQYARLITSAFLHASVLHLATNMITLYIVGAPLERVLRPVRYLIVYFLSALGGSLVSVWLSPEFSIGVGASGAIFGLFGALVVLRRHVGAEAGGLAVLIGLNLVISFTLPNISWQAHIGGLVTGVLVALVLRGIDRVSRRRPAT